MRSLHTQFSFGIFGCMSLLKFKISYAFHSEYSFCQLPRPIDNLTETLEFSILKNKPTFEQTLPISLNISKFDSKLLRAPRNLKDFIHLYKCKKEIFDLKERYDTIHINLDTNKNFFSNNSIVDVFLFVTAII